ncbi:MAG: GGDEF domain-containing protein [Deltaproteobacteria bacterium]|nr:GGDEF domain-containing protein [Deltaproteobacteria bacterium]
MGSSDLYLPWVIVAVLAGVVIALLGRGRRRPRTGPKPGPDLNLVAELRTQLQQVEQRYRAQVEFFVNFPEVVKTLTAALNVGQVTAACSRAFTTLLGTRRVAIFLTHENGKLLLVDGAGFPAELRSALTITVATSPLKPVIEYRCVCELKDTPEAVAILATRGLPDGLASSVWYGERLLGLILLADYEVDRHMAHRIVAMLADLMSVGLHAAGLVSQIRHDAENDALTGLANRRSLMVRIATELQRTRSYGSRLSLIMIDVDHFKKYNDQNGHGPGDEVLKKVASLMAATIRRTDLVARYGGEEFTVLLSGADGANAQQTAERVRLAVEANDFPNGKSQPLGRVTISLGYATFPDDACDVAGLFKAADAALYQAKSQGRNRVVAYAGPQIPEGGESPAT